MGPRRLEEWAAAIISAHLGTEAVVHDDGRASAMYDIRIGAVDAPDVAIECTVAVDPRWTETWNVGPAQGPIYTDLPADWIVSLRPGARVRGLQRRLAVLLSGLEAPEQTGIEVDWRLRRSDIDLYERLEAEGINSIWCSRREGSGKVHLTLPGFGRAADSTGKAVPSWISGFLGDPSRADVLTKLRRSRARECHAFVMVTLGGAPFAVDSYLTDPERTLPVADPSLPDPLDGVWIMHEFSASGIRWANTWQFVDGQQVS